MVKTAMASAPVKTEAPVITLQVNVNARQV